LDRARHIHHCLGQLGSASEKYSDRLKGAPAELMDNGLLQALAFYRSKKEEEYKKLVSHLEDWLVRGTNLLRVESGRSALEAISALDATQYRRCSEEAIAWLNLAKRLALARAYSQGR
jgi:CRISPR-associated protein Cmr5